MFEEQKKTEEITQIMPRKKRLDSRSFLLGFFIALAVFTLCFILYSLAGDKEKLIRGMIHRYELRDVTDEQIDDGKYHGMVSAFGDDYAAYFNKSEYASYQTKQQGAFVGLGISFITQQDPKRIVVAAVYADSPAEKAGILPGDEVVSAAGIPAEELVIEDLAERIRGGLSPVEMTVRREGAAEPITVEMIPAEVETPTVYYELKGDVGCIYISNFRKNTPAQFKEAYEKMQADAPRALIIDLRDNGGGLVNAVVDVMNTFVPEGLLVYTQNKTGKIKEYTSKCKEPVDIPVAVLVNGNTASSAEIMAGAIRDRGVGILVGTQTFGKGIVQTTYDLPDGSAVRLTTASYFTPEGTDLGGVGLTPDVECEQAEGAAADWSDTDTQYLAALDALS